MFTISLYLLLCMCSRDVWVNARRELRCSVFSFHLFIDSGDQSQVARLAQLGHIASPNFVFLRRGLSVESGATRLGDAGSASPRDPLIASSWRLQLQVHATVPCCFHECGELNLGPQACMQSFTD